MAHEHHCLQLWISNGRLINKNSNYANHQFIHMLRWWIVAAESIYSYIPWHTAYLKTFPLVFHKMSAVSASYALRGRAHNYSLWCQTYPVAGMGRIELVTSCFYFIFLNMKKKGCALMWMSLMDPSRRLSCAAHLGLDQSSGTRDWKIWMNLKFFFFKIFIQKFATCVQWSIALKFMIMGEHVLLAAGWV